MNNLSDLQRRQMLADFLRTRRARLSPSDVGMPESQRRRTPGLRREEVAQLAAMGIGWYTALEQGHDIHPSPAILESLARALRLTPDERRHLFLLADQLPPMNVPPVEGEVSPGLLRILERLDPDPAYVVGRRWDLLAWNRAAEAVFNFSLATPPYERNLVWQIFVDPDQRYHRRQMSPTWEQTARKVLGEFRASSARYPGDPWFSTLIEDLRQASPDFRAWWSLHDVRGTVDGHKELEHARVGRLHFQHTTLQSPDDSDLKLMIYSPLPHTDTAAKLETLLHLEPVQADQSHIPSTKEMVRRSG